MGILLVGLCGVAALLPAGRFEIVQGAKIDHATMVGRAAFREIKIRGFLKPVIPLPPAFQTDGWIDSSGTFVYPVNPVAVVMDPLGLKAPTNFGSTFPQASGSPAPTLARIVPSLSVNSTPLADPVFRSSDDLLFQANTNTTLPPVQQMFGTAKRASDGNYSWIATVVSDPTRQADQCKITVSVAVFYKRNLAMTTGGTPTPEGESFATIAAGNFFAGGVSGGEVRLDFTADSQAKQAFKKGVKTGQWLMLAGPLAGNNYFRWYRVVAAGEYTSANQQLVTLAGPDWNPAPAPATVYLLDGVIAVYEKDLRLEL